MADRLMYHEESRKLQDQFDTRRLAHRLVERLVRSTFNDEDRTFIESQRMFFPATTDADGFPGAQLLVRVTPRHVFPNRPRYIPRMQIAEPSPYVPRAGCSAPIPRWKTSPQFKEVLAADDPARKEG